MVDFYGRFRSELTFEDFYQSARVTTIEPASPVAHVENTGPLGNSTQIYKHFVELGASTAIGPGRSSQQPESDQICCVE